MEQATSAAVKTRSTRTIIAGLPAEPAKQSQQVILADWSEMVDITPETAAQWLRDYRYEGQRRVNKNHVAFLAAEMRGGRFQPSEFRIAHRGEVAYLTNGQHRLLACVQSGVTIRGNVYHRQTDNMDSVAVDYGNADIGKKRNITDALAATNLVLESGLSISKFNMVAAAMKPIITGFSPTSGTSMDGAARSVGLRVKAMQGWGSEANAFFSQIEGGDINIQRTLFRSAPLAVGLVSLRYQPDMAAPFWRFVAQNDGLKKGTPAHTLANWLKVNPAQKFPIHVYARYVAAAWNAYFENRPLGTLMLSKSGITRPIYIAGTIYDGKKAIPLFGE